MGLGKFSVALSSFVTLHRAGQPGHLISAATTTMPSLVWMVGVAAYAVAVLLLAGAADSSAVATSDPALYVAPLAVSTNATASSVHIPDLSSPQQPQQPPPHTHPWPATPAAAEFALIMAVAAAAYVAVAA
ncbi:hypothetical protein HK405_000440, partial [Cladochytrium tenue]